MKSTELTEKREIERGTSLTKRRVRAWRNFLVAWPAFDFLGLLEDGDGENIGGVEGINLEF